MKMKKKKLSRGFVSTLLDFSGHNSILDYSKVVLD